MYEQFKEYFDSIGLTQDAFVERTKLALATLAEVMPEPIVEVIVEDVVDEEGNRSYLHLGGVSENFIGFVENFIHTSDNAFIGPMGPASNLRVTKQAFDFKEATKESRLQVHVVIGASTNWNIQTTGSNCEHAWRLVQEQLRPRMFASEAQIPQTPSTGQA